MSRCRMKRTHRATLKDGDRVIRGIAGVDAADRVVFFIGEDNEDYSYLLHEMFSKTISVCLHKRKR